MTRSAALLILCIIGFGAGLGWWIAPGAGIAAASVVAGVLTVLLVDDGPRP